MYPDNLNGKYNNSDSAFHRDLFGAPEKCETGESLKGDTPLKGRGFSFVQKFFLTLLCVCSFLILILPFVPEAIFQSREVLGLPHDQREELDMEYVSDKEEYSKELEENTLIIPSIGVNSSIVEGENESVLSKGVWRRPGTGNPEDGGNTVITGHRFHYIPPNNNTFYNLDKLEEDRKIYIYWGGKGYKYVVYEKFIVDETEVGIEEDLDGNILTLYTCYPLWSADERLVVRAKLMD